MNEDSPGTFADSISPPQQWRLLSGYVSRQASSSTIGDMATPTMTVLPSIGIPSFTKEYQSATIPQALSDEIEVLNSIYGDGTIEIAHAHNGRITTEVKLIGTDLPTLQLAFPVSYPEDPPEVLDFKIFVRERSYRTRTARLIVLSVIQARFVKGFECIFDLLDSCLPILSLLGEHGLSISEAIATVPGFIVDEWLWTLSENVNTKNVKAIGTCVICYDEHYAFKMVSLPCQHLFCIGCFQNGWNVSLKAHQPFTCCKIRIRLDMIEKFNLSQTIEIRRYIRMLQERDTDYPFYCGFATCSFLIGNIRECRIRSNAALNGGVICPKCLNHTCVRCRMPSHAKECPEDAGLSALMDEDMFRRCPKCGQGIEKNGGCSHMICKTCGCDFQWEANGTVTLSRSS